MHCTKRKPQAGCCLGLLSCRLNLGYWAGRQGVGGWGAAQLNPARQYDTQRPIGHVLVITKNTNLMPHCLFVTTRLPR